ncbi:LOW QUALITY PROTEIN: hypothetical protein V2J09_009858 [Rumex salicifolius]
MTKLARLSQILRNCMSSKSISIVKQIHASILTDVHFPYVTISTDLLLAYTRCALLKHTRNVFVEMPNRYMHSWNFLISSYHCLFSDAISVFVKFVIWSFHPDHYTLHASLKACSGTQCFDLGLTLHNWILRNGFEDCFCGSLLDLYIKSGDVTSARKLFMRSSSLNMMISGFTRAGCFAEALDCFRSMIRQREEFYKNDYSKGAGDLMKGKEIHGKLVQCSSFDIDVAIENYKYSTQPCNRKILRNNKNSFLHSSALVLHSGLKSGCLPASEYVFKLTRERNLVTWTTMISCYGHHGKGKEALALFEKMQEHGH